MTCFTIMFYLWCICLFIQMSFTSNPKPWSLSIFCSSLETFLFPIYICNKPKKCENSLLNADEFYFFFLFNYRLLQTEPPDTLELLCFFFARSQGTVLFTLYSIFIYKWVLRNNDRWLYARGRAHRFLYIHQSQILDVLSLEGLKWNPGHELCIIYRSLFVVLKLIFYALCHEMLYPLRDVLYFVFCILSA